MIGNSNDEYNFPSNLLTNSSANIDLSKTYLHKVGQSGEFLGRPLWPLPKIWLAFNEKCT